MVRPSYPAAICEDTEYTADGQSSNEGTVYTECETWRLFTDSDGLDALTHYFCEISSASSNVFGPWPTPRPESSTSSYSCVASSFSSPHEGDCASPIGIILPLILSNVVYFAINALAGNFKFQIRCQFWKSSRDLVRPEDYIWTPWPGLGSAVLVVVQAAVTAYLVRAGGYGASFKDLMLLWLVRPRMMWSQLLFYVGFGRNYKGSATDALFADTILNIFSIPVLATAITAALKYKGICDADGMVGQTFEGYTKDGLTVLRAFGSDDDAYYLSVYTYFYLAMSGLGIFCLAFFLYKRRLGRWWTIAPLFWSVATFIASWLYWTSKLLNMDRIMVSMMADICLSRIRTADRGCVLSEEHCGCLGHPRCVSVGEHAD